MSRAAFVTIAASVLAASWGCSVESRSAAPDDSTGSGLGADAYSSAVLQSGPIAYYRLDDTGATAADSAPNHLDGARGTGVGAGAKGLLASSSDGAMSFPGTQSASGSVVVPRHTLLEVTSAVSVELLLEVASTPKQYAVPVSYGSDSGNAPYDLLFLGGKLAAQFNLDTGVLVITAPTALALGVPHHVVSTYDGSTGRLYIDGVQVASGAKAGKITGYYGTYGLAIGDDAGFSDPGVAGTMDEVAVYGKALTASDVSAHYAATKGSAPPPPMDAGTPPPAMDAGTPPPPTGTVIWKAGDPLLGKWEVANTYQCVQTPVNNGTSFTFEMIYQSNGSCGRNQAVPLTQGSSLVQLTDGATYAWEFDYIDGTPTDAPPGMGPDVDARSLIWQIHGLNEPDSPCTGLIFGNGNLVGSSGPQKWGFTNCNGVVWTGDYTPGEKDHFKIVATISEGSSGSLTLYRNGAHQGTWSGGNYHNSQGEPWWNFGPYKWRWELAGGGGSNMKVVNATIDNLVLTKL